MYMYTDTILRAARMYVSSRRVLGGDYDFVQRLVNIYIYTYRCIISFILIVVITSPQSADDKSGERKGIARDLRGDRP